MKKILIILLIISVLIICGCNSEPKIMSEEEAKYHANIYLKQEYPTARYNIRNAVQKDNNWEFNLMHNFYDESSPPIFEGYICLDNKGRTELGITPEPFC